MRLNRIVTSHEFEAPDFKQRASNPGIMGCVDPKVPFKQAFRTPNRGLESSFCSWTAGQGLAEKDSFVYRKDSFSKAPQGTERGVIGSENPPAYEKTLTLLCSAWFQDPFSPSPLPRWALLTHGRPVYICISLSLSIICISLSLSLSLSLYIYIYIHIHVLQLPNVIVYYTTTYYITSLRFVTR